jgi:mersacidin/lichenicidin family type 2 lantibiotic
VYTVDIIRAWTDDQYWACLSERERASVPPNPAGIVELSDTELLVVAGGTATIDACDTYYCETVGYGCGGQMTPSKSCGKSWTSTAKQCGCA